MNDKVDLVLKQLVCPLLKSKLRLAKRSSEHGVSLRLYFELLGGKSSADPFGSRTVIWCSSDAINVADLLLCRQLRQEEGP